MAMSQTGATSTHDGIPSVLAGQPSPQAGELWALVWDGEVLGHVVVASAKKGYVLAWPASPDPDDSFRPGVLLKGPTGKSLTAWPTRETGIGNHLLAGRLDILLPASMVHRIAAQLDDDEEPDVTWAHRWGTLSEDEHFAERWSALCHHTGRGADGHYLDEGKAKSAGLSSRWIAQRLDLDPEDARAIWLGEETLTSEQADRVASGFAGDIADILGPDPALDMWSLLAEPLFKREVWECAQRAGLSETVMRLRASRDAYALAARDDSMTRNSQKLLDALHRIASSAENLHD